MGDGSTTQTTSSDTMLKTIIPIPSKSLIELEDPKWISCLIVLLTCPFISSELVIRSTAKYQIKW